MNIRQIISHNYYNIQGWHSKTPIVVIESDDWGSIRMPSKEVFDRLLKAGIRVDKCHYCSNDSLASEIDLQYLFEVLASVKDVNNHPAVFTANAVVANPDFDRIRESEFHDYYYKTLNESFKEVKGCENSLHYWFEGMKADCFVVQSHGREHLNVKRWMQCLNDTNYKETRIAFDNGVYGISTIITAEKRDSFLPAFDYKNLEEEQFVNEIAADGLRIFNELIGYKATSFIAPNYIWGKPLEKVLCDNGVKYIQGRPVQFYIEYGNKTTREIHAMGQKNIHNQLYLVRNAQFEPSSDRNKDWVDSCLHDIEIAFRWNAPVVISSHRVNYVGTINPSNRDQNLILLKRLLKTIVKKYPSTVFMSSDQLGDLILNDYERR